MTVSYSTPGVFMHRSSRAGAAAVEMAVVLPLFLLVVFGIVEFGRGMLVRELLANTARLGPDAQLSKARPTLKSRH